MDRLDEMALAYEESLRYEGMEEDKIRVLMLAFITGFSAGVASHDEDISEEMKQLFARKNVVN